MSGDLIIRPFKGILGYPVKKTPINKWAQTICHDIRIFSSGVESLQRFTTGERHSRDAPEGVVYMSPACSYLDITTDSTMIKNI